MDSAYYPFVLVALGIVAYFIKNEKFRFKHVPAVGLTFPGLSYISAVQYLFQGNEMLYQGYNKYKGRTFKIPDMARWQIVVTGPQLVDEIRKAPDEILSFEEAVLETLQTKKTMGPRFATQGIQIQVIRNQLTRNLGTIFADVQDELQLSFKEIIPLTDDWTAVPALQSIMQIVCRTSNRVFVGPSFCRRPDWLKLGVEFTIDLVKAAMVLNCLPGFLKPIAAKLGVNVRSSLAQAYQILAPEIEARRKQIELHGEKWEGKPNDFLSWLMDDAEGEEASTEVLVSRILGMNFAAIHTSSMSFTHALFYLASNPEYAQILREEVETVIREDGWSKTSVQLMEKLDSFMRETQRMCGLGSMAMSRKVMKDYTLCDGTFLPAGSLVAVASGPMHHDSEFYEDAQLFKPWRFADLRKEEGKHTKYQFVNTSNDFVSFGHGRHACPGRFFAVNELKTMMAHIVLTYDVKLEKDGVIPKAKWFKHSLRPNPTARVLFRKRQT